MDYGTKCILGSGPNGFRCLNGCHGKVIDLNQFEYRRSFSFDEHENIFFSLKANIQIQIFHLQKDSCGEFEVVSQKLLSNFYVDVSSKVQAQYSSI